MRKWSIFFVLLFTCLMVQSAVAHPADMYFHTHRVTLQSDGIVLTWEFLPGPMVTHILWQNADQDQDGQVSDQEAMAWTQQQLPALQVRMDDEVDLSLELRSVVWPSSMDLFRTGDEMIVIDLYSPWPGGSQGEHTVQIDNLYLPANSIYWFYLNAGDEAGFQTPIQNSGSLKVAFVIEPEPGLLESLEQAWESGRPSIPVLDELPVLGGIAQDASSQTTQRTGVGAVLEGLLRTPQLSPAFLLAALAISVLIGALHALSPGHGKTIVAAYLVGAQGKAYHAVALGSIVTLTHTGSVFALGLLTLAASRYIMLDQIFPLLEIVSGVLIVLLGIGLLVPRLRAWVSARRQRQSGRRQRIENQVRSIGGRSRLAISEDIRESGPEHSHDSSRFGYVPVPKGRPGRKPLEGISWRSLIALGISGGLVPCPDAIAILLVAVTINRIALGLSLIVAFSLGLAIVLIVIGMTMVGGQRLFARLGWFDRASVVVPVISALIVTGLGIGLTVSAARNANWNGAEFAGYPGEYVADFEPTGTTVVYRALDAEYMYQIYSIEIGATVPLTLTSIPQGIWDFALSPDGQRIAFAAPLPDTGTGIWTLPMGGGEPQPVVPCENATCSSLVWSPDGEQLLFSRNENVDISVSLGVPSIWWLDIASGDYGPLFQDANLPGYNPSWSPDGRWLSYTSTNSGQIHIYDLWGEAEDISLPSLLGAPVEWRPDSQALLYTDIEEGEQQMLTRLMHYDLQSRVITPLGAGSDFDDTQVAWSADGQTIAVVRRVWKSGQPAVGDQIWLTEPDGDNAVQVTHDEKTLHGAPIWSPDGRYLLYQVYDINNETMQVGIRLLEIATGEWQEVVSPGSQPEWAIP